MTDKTDNEILTEATDRLRKGWCKKALGQTHLSEGPVCMRGALMYATSPSVDRVDRIEDTFLRPVIRELFPERSEGAYVPPFNDHEDTTLEDVILVMEKATANS